MLLTITAVVARGPTEDSQLRAKTDFQ